MSSLAVVGSSQYMFVPLVLIVLLLTFGDVYDDPALEQSHGLCLQSQNTLSRATLSVDDTTHSRLVGLDILHQLGKLSRLLAHQRSRPSEQTPPLGSFESLSRTQRINDLVAQTHDLTLERSIIDVGSRKIIKTLDFDGIGVGQHHSFAHGLALAFGWRLAGPSSLLFPLDFSLGLVERGVGATTRFGDGNGLLFDGRVGFQGGAGREGCGCL